MSRTNGIEIEVDRLGRILIPIKYRKKLGIALKSKMILSLEDGGILLSPIRSGCVLCGGKIEQDKKIPLCNSCIAKIKNEYE